MTVTLTAPVVDITLAAPAPYVVLSCSLTLPAPAAPEEGVIVVPVPPGVDYDTLPTIDPETQIVDTSPDQVIGCANALYAGVEQDILNHLYPSAIAGDGVIDRSTNNFWVYDGSTWNNVGPNPGPTVINTPVLPPWDVVRTYDARVRTRLEVESLAYGLELLTEPAAYGISVGMIVQRVMPVTRFTLDAPVPAYVGTRATVIQPGTGTIALSAFAPSRTI